MNRNVRMLVVLVIGLLAPLGILLAHGIWGADLPDPLPTHWTGGGRVDGTTGAGVFFAWTLTISLALLVISAVTLLAHRVHHTGRLLIAVLVAASVLVGSIYVLSAAVSRHHSSADDVALPWYALALAVLVPLVVGALVWKLIAPAPITDVHRPASGLGLRASERVVWIAHAQSTGLRIAAVALAVVAVLAGVFLFHTTTVAVIMFVVALLLAWTSELTTRVDDEGLHVLWGPLGWPRQRILLGAIAQVHAQDIRPMQWGGWGYRITSRGTASIVRSGSGIVVEKRDGNTFVVTTDDAEQGADVLNALLVRSHTGQ